MISGTRVCRKLSTGNLGTGYICLFVDCIFLGGITSGLSKEYTFFFFNISLLFQSEKLTKREVEAKFCNFSLSTNSVSVPAAAPSYKKIKQTNKDPTCSSLARSRRSPFLSRPVADVVQVHRTEGGPAGAGPTAAVTHQTQDCCQSTRQAGAQGPGGGHGVAAETGGEAAGGLNTGLKEAAMCVCFLHLFFFLNSDPSHQQVVINLGLVYKVQHHSGVIFQFVAFIRKRKRTVPDIIAAGGRYDHLVGLIATRLCVANTCLLFPRSVHTGFNSVLLDCGVSGSSTYRTGPLCCRSQFSPRKGLLCPGYHGGAGKKHTLSHT